MNEKNTNDEIFARILEKVRGTFSEDQIETLRNAYQFSLNAHQNQKRAGGQPFIIHPLSVTEILADFHLDAVTLTAGLLHDVLEDTSISRQTLLSQFGEEVTRLVEGVTKIENLELQIPEETPHRSAPEILKQAENWRKMLIATAQDIRVIFLKLADRKHNMDTLEFLPEEKRKRIAEETLTLYAPLAQRLGMYRLKSLMEDSAFKYREPERHAELEKKMSTLSVRQEEFLKKCVEKIEAFLAPYEIPHRISARPKNLHSIYRKMLRQNKPFEEIQDLAGARLITDTVEHCYALLGILQTQWPIVPNSFTDYIAIPKSNLYQSLHISIEIEPEEILEIQIRTEHMHRIADLGIAAHWKYKESGGLSRALEHSQKEEKLRDSVDNKLDWIKQILEWQQDTSNPKEFLEGLKVELDFDQIFVFTPKREVIKLPLGSTPIDFAYAVHSELGDRCMGAKVDGKMVRLDQKLRSGTCCEILTRKGQNPHKDWLDFVKTPRARSKIRKFLRDGP